MRSMVEGVLPSPKNPSTSLRLVTLPAKSRGGFFHALKASFSPGLGHLAL
jgi:hypothetical protein